MFVSQKRQVVQGCGSGQGQCWLVPSIPAQPDLVVLWDGRCLADNGLDTLKRSEVMATVSPSWYF